MRFYAIWGSFYRFLRFSWGSYQAIKFSSNPTKSSRNRSKSDRIEIGRPQNGQISNINFAFFARFWAKPTKTSAKAKNSIFSALYNWFFELLLICLGFYKNYQISSIFNDFKCNCLCRTIRCHFLAFLEFYKNLVNRHQNHLVCSIFAVTVWIFAVMLFAL